MRNALLLFDIIIVDKSEGGKRRIILTRCLFTKTVVVQSSCKMTLKIDFSCLDGKSKEVD